MYAILNPACVDGQCGAADKHRKLVERLWLGGKEAFTSDGFLTPEVNVASDVRFAKIQKLLESHGWILQRIRGSHYIFSKAGQGSFPVPVHQNRVKAVYVRKIEKIIAAEKGETAS